MGNFHPFPGNHEAQESDSSTNRFTMTKGFLQYMLRNLKCLKVHIEPLAESVTTSKDTKTKDLDFCDDVFFDHLYCLYWSGVWFYCLS